MNFKKKIESKSKNTGKIGAFGELLVCADMLNRGFEVFRSVSPTGSCDLIALWEGKARRVEVRTAIRQKNGKIYSPVTDPSKYDILAQVLPEEIVYKPEID